MTPHRGKSGKRNKAALGSVLRVAAFALLYLALVSGVLLAIFVFYLSKDLPTIEQISNRQVNQSTKIYDRTGSVLLYEISNGRRERLLLSKKYRSRSKMRPYPSKTKDSIPSRRSTGAQ